MLVGTVSTGGSIAVKPYEKVGPSAQNYGYGFGISQWNGSVSGAATSTLNGSLSANSLVQVVLVQMLR